MKTLIAVVAAFLVASTAHAGDRLFIVGGNVVQVKDLDNVAPFVVRQNLPIQRNVVGFDAYGRQFVRSSVTNFPVFLPAGVPRRVRYGRNFQKFDYGKFEVEIRVRRDGRVVVDYDD